MTYLDVAYHYRDVPTEKEMRAIGSIREVYGVLQVQFDEKERTVKVRFDASRLNEEEIAGLLRQAGLAVQARLILS